MLPEARRRRRGAKYSHTWTTRYSTCSERRLEERVVARRCAPPARAASKVPIDEVAEPAQVHHERARQPHRLDPRIARRDTGSPEEDRDETDGDLTVRMTESHVGTRRPQQSVDQRRDEHPGNPKSTYAPRRSQRQCSYSSVLATFMPEYLRTISLSEGR